MKNLLKDRIKLLLIISLIFLLTITILLLLPKNIGNVLTYIIFPIYFFAITTIYWKYKKFNEILPTELTIIYLIFGYMFIGSLISPLKVLIAYLSGEIPLLIGKMYFKLKKKRLSKEEIKLNDKQSRIVNYLLPLMIITILEFYYTITTFNVAYFPTGILAIIIGIIIVYAIYIILLSIFRRTSTTAIVFALLMLTIFIINEGRIYYTSDSLILSDILLIKSAGEVASLDVTLFNCIKFIFIPTLLVLILYIYVFKLAIRSDFRVRFTKRHTIRLIGSLLILLILIIPNEKLDKFMVNTVYNINDGYDYAITASNTRYYKRYGVISGMYGKLIEARRLEPDNYDEKELVALLNNATKIEGTWKKPNIIVIFSESFWDIGKLENVKFDKDVVANFNRLKNEGQVIEMLSPSYGGISSNVEFEILTGGSLNYFSKGYTTYIQLFKKGVSEDNPSIIRELKNNGYKTKILNSSSATMFNCDYIYDIYDIDERNHLYDELEHKLGEYVTDEYLTDQIIEYFNNKPKDEKTFFFTITMGGHMPYYEERYENYDINIVESSYDKETNGVLHAYAEGIYLADQQLGRLYDYIQTLDEDTIVVFFGDHLPHLITPDGIDALFIDYLSDEYELDSVYNQFNTTALILSNYDIENDGTKYLSPDLLMTYILNNMDIELSPFYKWLYTTKETLPSSNNVVSQDNNGDIYYTLALENEMKKTYETRRNMQYMLFK